MRVEESEEYKEYSTGRRELETSSPEGIPPTEMFVTNRD